jgi:hypothetical protein
MQQSWWHPAELLQNIWRRGVARMAWRKIMKALAYRRLMAAWRSWRLAKWHQRNAARNQWLAENLAYRRNQCRVALLWRNKSAVRNENMA